MSINPLGIFCGACCLAAVITAAIFPRDSQRAEPTIVFGLTVWTFITFTILLYEWSPRPQESEVRTYMRRVTVLSISALTTCMTIAYSSELMTSSWGAIRGAFLVAAIADLLHTVLIHLLYVIAPDSQPKVAIAHTSGVRMGPPEWTSYAPLVCVLLFVLIMKQPTRERISCCISCWVGLNGLRISLAELAEVPALAGDSRSLAPSWPHAKRTGTGTDGKASSSDSTIWQQGALDEAAACARPRAESDARSDVSSACSELHQAFSRNETVRCESPPSPSPPEELCPEEGKSAAPRPVGGCLAFVLPEYRLLSPFYGEVTSADAARQALPLRVACGRLVDPTGMPLAPEAERLAIFVMDSFGALLYTVDWQGANASRRQKCYHSGLIDGRPVAAAGLMRILDGRLLALSNESGHYAPPPSTLVTVLCRLAAMGLEDIENVQLERLCTTLTQPEARPKPLLHGRRRNETAVTTPEDDDK